QILLPDHPPRHVHLAGIAEMHRRRVGELKKPRACFREMAVLVGRSELVRKVHPVYWRTAILALPLAIPIRPPEPLNERRPGREFGDHDGGGDIDAGFD